MRTVAIFSGGLDSTVMLHHLLDAGDEVLALSINYGQRHRRELQHAERIAGALGLRWELADISSVCRLLSGSSLTSPELPVPHGHYAAESMKQTVVPNRNMIMLAIAGGWAISEQADRVAYGAHTGDHTIYPDCRPEFAAAMNTALGLADWRRIELVCPFIAMTKTDIVRRGVELKVEFTQTWSCYEGDGVHCGRCGTCVERKEAFTLAGIEDPTVYAAE